MPNLESVMQNYNPNLLSKHTTPAEYAHALAKKIKMPVR